MNYDSCVNPDDEVCLCFHVSLRKIRTFLARENPPVASLISECLSAGTGCMWCVPFLKHLHGQHQRGETPDLRVSPEQYVKARLDYHQTGERDKEVLQRGMQSHEDGEPEKPGGLSARSGAGGALHERRVGDGTRSRKP